MEVKFQCSSCAVSSRTKFWSRLRFAVVFEVSSGSVTFAVGNGDLGFYFVSREFMEGWEVWNFTNATLIFVIYFSPVFSATKQGFGFVCGRNFGHFFFCERSFLSNEEFYMTLKISWCLVNSFSCFLFSCLPFSALGV